MDVNIVVVMNFRKRNKMENKPAIYTITTVRGFLAGGCRAVGFAWNLADANNWVVSNSADINEDNHYPFAVIEECEEGIYMVPIKEYWYQFDRDTETYSPCEKPERFKSTVCWGLG